MKSIRTLIPDIYSLVKKRDGWLTEEGTHALANEIAGRLRQQFAEQKAPSLRLSKMGPTCPKALWAYVNAPGEAEVLPPWAQIKFSYGHILEALVITLAKEAGHTVEGEQDELIVDGICGHRDCVIDGCVVDVKSATSMGIDDLKKETVEHIDRFGYLSQLDAYLVGSRDDPLVKVKDKGYLLAIDKTLGHLYLYEHTLREDFIQDRIRQYAAIVKQSTPPPCGCGTKPDGKSGNISLDVRASYSPFKYYCFPQLRTFLYAKGPVYLTHVARKPDVPEIDRHGNIVYRN